MVFTPDMDRLESEARRKDFNRNVLPFLSAAAAILAVPTIYLGAAIANPKAVAPVCEGQRTDTASRVVINALRGFQKPNCTPK